MMLSSASQGPRFLARGSRQFKRGISNIQKPQAYLRPLVDSAGAEEFEGVMCLVMDRKEAKNALSVQMVGVSLSHLSSDSVGLMIGNEGSYSEITIYKFVRLPQLGSRRTILDELRANGRARLLLLHTPHSGVFCAGADLRERRTMSQTQVSDFLDSLRGLISELEGVNVPSIGVVDGYALGGGMEIALGCDLRVGGMFKSPLEFNNFKRKDDKR